MTQKFNLTGLRLPQAAFRDLVPERSQHASTGVVNETWGGLRQAHVVGS